MPLETDSSELIEALEHLEQGRYREGIEVLERGLVQSSVIGRRKNALVKVPQVLPRSLPELKLALALVVAAESGNLALPVANPVPGAGKAVRAPPSPVLRREAPRPGRRFLELSTISEACLAALPPDGLKVYRELYDPIARSLYNSYLERRNVEDLERVAAELFFTNVGDNATEALGDLAFEAGSYTEALKEWRRVLHLHPDSDVPRARIFLKVLEALRLLKSDPEYDLLRAQFLSAFPAQAGMLAQLEQALPIGSRSGGISPPPSSRWGGEIGSEPEVLSLEPDGLLELSWDSWAWSRRGVPDLGKSEPRRRPFPYRGDSDVSPYFAFCPLIDAGRVFVSGVFSLYSFDARPGVGVLRKEYPKPLGRSQASRYEERENYDSGLYTTTLWKRQNDPGCQLEGLPEEVLITHYVSDRVRPTEFMKYDITVELPIRSLVAFDARNGHVLWQTGTEEKKVLARGGLLEDAQKASPRGALQGRPAKIEASDEEMDDDEDVAILDPQEPLLPRAGGPDDSEGSKPRDFSFTSPAVVKAGRVVASGWVQRGYVNSSLRCLSLATGALIWETFLSGFQMEPTMFGELAREPLAGAILESDGVVYVANQGGVIAAVEIETGRARWIMSYDTIEIGASFQRQALRRVLSWGLNPMILLGHILLVTPRDSEFLYAVDTGTGPEGRVAGGQILWRFRNPVLASGQAELRDLLGHAEGRLYFSGPGDIVNGPAVVTALDLRQLDVLGRLPNGGPPMKLPPVRVPGPISGAGVVTRSGVLYADGQGLQLVSLDLKSVRPLTLGAYRPAEVGSYPGRITVSGGRVYMTSRRLLSAYAPTSGPAK